MRNILAAAAAFGLATAPVAAQAGTRANDIVPASVSVERDAQPITGASSMGDRESIIPTAFLVGMIAIAVVFALEILDDDDDDDAISDG